MAKVRKNKRAKKYNSNKRTPAEIARSRMERHLDQHELVELEYMINNNAKYDDIIKEMQTKWLKMVEYTPITLKQYLVQYNKFVLKPKLITQVENVDVYKELLAMKGKVDVLKEYTVLFLQQKVRVQRVIDVENHLFNEKDHTKHHKMSDQARKEIKVMSELLEKIGKVQMETGALKRAPRYISGEFKEDEKDPTKITFNLQENFMEVLDDIEAELKEVLEVEDQSD